MLKRYPVGFGFDELNNGCLDVFGLSHELQSISKAAEELAESGQIHVYWMDRDHRELKYNQTSYYIPITIEEYMMYAVLFSGSCALLQAIVAIINLIQKT